MTATATAAAGVLSAVIVLAGCGAAAEVTAANVASAKAPAVQTTAGSSHPGPAPSAPAGGGTGTAVPPTSPPSTGGSARFGTVDRADPTAVAEAMLDAAFSSDTTADATPFAAVRRSLTWYKPAAAARVLASAPTGPVGAEWITWTAHKATTTVVVQTNTDPGAPADTATSADRQFNVIVTPHGEDGWTTAPDQYQCFVTLTRTSPTGPWQVANLQTAQ